MCQYIRDRTQGGCYFLTLTLERRHNGILVEQIEAWRDAYRQTQQRYPFYLDAMVVLPDHIHMMCTLPPLDDRYGLRVAMLKGLFSRKIPKLEVISESRQNKRERGIWQRRFWEHRIRDDVDYRRHADYIHYNPVKHGYVEQVRDWSFSTFHAWVEQGKYPIDWASC